MAKPRKTKRKEKAVKRRPKRRKTIAMHRVRDISPVTMLLAAIIVATLIYYFVSNSMLVNEGPPITETTTTAVPPMELGESLCGDLDMNIDTIIQASSYGRFGLESSATEDRKFVILHITAKNEADSTRDFSGYRMELTASGDTYIPMIFNDMESLTLLDGTSSDYACEELALAHVSRFELAPKGVATGCKMFRVSRDAEADTLILYDLAGMICVIDL